MRIAYLDCFSGISGDMFLGALVDAGVPEQLLEETVAALDIGARLEISRVSATASARSKSMFMRMARRICHAKCGNNNGSKSAPGMK